MPAPSRSCAQSTSSPPPHPRLIDIEPCALPAAVHAVANTLPLAVPPRRVRARASPWYRLSGDETARRRRRPGPGLGSGHWIWGLSGERKVGRPLLVDGRVAGGSCTPRLSQNPGVNLSAHRALVIQRWAADVSSARIGPAVAVGWRAAGPTCGGACRAVVCISAWPIGRGSRRCV